MKSDKIAVRLIVTVSVLIPVTVAILMLMPKGEESRDFSGFPLFHALLNGSAFLLLVTGFFLIKNMNIKAHRLCMLTAFALSSVFLISYVIYHYNTGHTAYGGTGIFRHIYFFILITHIVLAIAIIPLALFSIYRALNGEIEKHKRLVKWTLPVWLYVTFTGVLVYLIMKPYY